MTADAAALASIEAATRELRLPRIRLHAGRLAAEAQGARATYLGFLATPCPSRSMTGPSGAAPGESTRPTSRGRSDSPTSTSTSPPPSTRP
jgi:hypothetical protein